MSSSFLEAVDRRNADTYLSPPPRQLPSVFSVGGGSFLLTHSTINEIENEIKKLASSIKPGNKTRFCNPRDSTNSYTAS